MRFKLVSSIFTFLLIFISFLGFSQNREKTKERIIELSSPEYHGRGYINDGCNKAADYIAEEMEKIGVKSFPEGYFQELEFDVNTFPGKLQVNIDDEKLVPGVDFLIGPATPSVNDRFTLYKPDSLLLNDTTAFKKKLENDIFLDQMLVVDYAQTENIEIKKFYIRIMMDNEHFGGIVELIPEELMWAVRTFQNDYPVVKVKRESYPEDAEELTLKVKAKMQFNYEVKNVIGYIEGETDEFIVLTAHYDHLGRMGKKVYIHGAQDNASGTAMVLDFAEYYADVKPHYSIAFMLFAGEEAGLFGSINYVTNPLFDLSKIKMVINLDMVGTGDDGITVVNGASPDYKKEWELFEELNIEWEFFTNLKARGEAANSDHYPFHAVGVPAVFIYTMGGKTYYHNPKDTPETLTFTGYEALFDLIICFIDKYE